MSTVVVIQSHTTPLPAGWLEPCVASVRRWSADRGFEHRFIGDALLERLPADLREKTVRRTVVATDIARLHALRDALSEGYDTALWLDADTLVFDPHALEPGSTSFAVGREVWVQAHDGRPRARTQVHNAYLMFRRGNPFLDFYIHVAEQRVREHRGPMVPQLVGPKLLTALHNAVGLPVEERAGVASPAVVRDLLAGGGRSLSLFRARSRVAPASVNLAASMVECGELEAQELEAVVSRLLERGFRTP